MAKNSQQYWDERSRQRIDESMLEAGNLNKLLKEIYSDSLSNIEKDISYLYAKYAGKVNLSYKEASKLIKGSEYRQWRRDIDGYLKLIDKAEGTQRESLILELETLASRSRITRLEALKAQIQAHIINMGIEEEELLYKGMKKVYEESYSAVLFTDAKMTGATLATNYAKLNEDYIRQAILTPWKGRNFSDSIWDNKRELLRQLRILTGQSLQEGKSVAFLSEQLSERMGVGYRDAKRLVVTEIANASTQGDLEAYRRLGIKTYIYRANLDSKTSDICKRLDGEEFKISEAKTGVNYPPAHPNCRSYTVKGGEQSEGTKLSKQSDGKYIEIDRNMGYREWHSRYYKPTGGGD
ncbi:phage Mu protein F like protein [Andreesenia angusta]|uniref:Phage Mu protein F like protein n=1 Tax=Andreesenia angusta TaxID=39480 RepID=A0A1S1V7P1_9FIRM|nr:minor capsid protein [Andreesenia angusta]OHW62177.1 phage Mu protein F like protein [Andreesenia angusta]